MTAYTRNRRISNAKEPETNLAAIEAFIHHEVRLLDERRFEEWMELFAEDGFYWAPTEPGQKDPSRTVSLFYDDRNAMKARFARLNHPRIHVQTPPSRTRHLVSGVAIEQGDEPGEYLVSSNFIMLEYRPGYEQRLYGGQFLHRLRETNGDLRILMKRAELINCDASFSAMAIPF
jgi:3-phenylpropionate/cinnamic acid dioxygenase small subunit